MYKFESREKFYSFVQANTIDSLLSLNDRFEYETLWRYPIRNELLDVIGERNELVNSGSCNFFSNFENIHNNMNYKYFEFQDLREDFQLNFAL